MFAQSTPKQINLSAIYASFLGEAHEVKVKESFKKFWFQFIITWRKGKKREMRKKKINLNLNNITNGARVWVRETRWEAVATSCEWIIIYEELWMIFLHHMIIFVRGNM